MSRYEGKVYVIGPDDTLLEVNEAFWRFGEENGLVGKPDTIIGRPLWDFVGTPSLKSLYRHILGNVRSKIKPFCFPLRCDPHQFCRFMTMTIAPRSDGIVRLIVELDRQVCLHSAAQTVSRSSRRALCRSCCKVEHEGEWPPRGRLRRSFSTLAQVRSYSTSAMNARRAASPWPSTDPTSISR
jgi:hypothetical protein